MLKERQLRAALRGHALTLADLSTLNSGGLIAWENRPFNTPDPDNGTMWVSERLVVQSERQTATGQNQADGSYELSIWTPVTAGTEEVDDLADLVVEHFSPVTGVSNGETEATIYRTLRLPLQKNPANTAWRVKTVVCLWRSFNTNPT